MTRTRGRRPLVCHHEPGHAVARWWLGFHVNDATVLTLDRERRRFHTVYQAENCGPEPMLIDLAEP